MGKNAIKHDLKRKLSLLDVFCVASGAMISSGIFVLPGMAHARAGPAVIVSYFLAGVLAMMGVLSQAELVSAMPRAGGTYFYVNRSMGPMVGTVDGILTWFSLSLKSAFALVGMAAFTRIIIALNIHVIAVVLVIIFIAINLIGIKEAGILQVILVFGLLGILLFYVFQGIPRVNVNHFENFAPGGLAAVFSTAGFVFISYGGLLKIASLAEEVEQPGRVIPMGMILSLLVVGLLYLLVIYVTSGVLGASQLDKSLTPITDGASKFLGNWGAILLSLAAILAFISTANAGIMAASRYPMALSRDGLLPPFFQRVNKKFNTPHISILFTGVFMVIAMFFKIDILVEAASTVLILTFLFSGIAVIIMRESGLQNYQPRFRAPLYPWVQIIGIIGFGTLLFEMGREVLFIGLILVLTALFIYWFYGRIRASKEYALMYLIERITSRELTAHLLENELKEIIRERDEITKDRFDKLIEECIVVDIEKKMEVEEFFEMAAEKLSERLKVETDYLYRKLLEREEESTTAINPDVAIPHIIVEGENKFEILIARSKEGIEFSEEYPDVNTVFVLMGTKDQRNFHLKTLAAIAQIVQSSEFSERWMSAKNKESLRDAVLLGKRRR